MHTRHALLVLAIAFVFSACQKAGQLSSTLSPPPSNGGNTDIYGGSDRARAKLMSALFDLRQVYEILGRGDNGVAAYSYASSPFAGDVCPAELPGGVPLQQSLRTLLERAGGSKLSYARQAIFAAARSSRDTLRTDFDALIDVSQEQVRLNGKPVAAIAPIGNAVFDESGKRRPMHVSWSYAVNASQDELLMLLGHEMFHETPETVFRGAFTDGSLAALMLPTALGIPSGASLSLSAAFPGDAAGSEMADLMGACLALFAQKHAYREDSITFLSSGSGAIYKLVFNRRTKEAKILAPEVAVPAAVTVKEQNGSLAPVLTGGICPPFLAQAQCPNGRFVDKVAKGDARFYLDSTGRLYDGTGVIVFEDSKVVSVGVQGDTFYLLRTDGSLLVGYDIWDYRTFGPVPNLQLRNAKRLVMGASP